MTYRTGFDRHQMQMLCWDDMIGPENPVRVIDVLVDQLDLEALGFATPKNDQGGSPAYAAADLLKLYLYGYSNRLRSSRQLEHTCTCNMEVIWLLRGLRPKHSTIADFRSRHPQALKAVFRRYVALLQGWDLVGGETIGIDSMKQRAQNSKKNNYNERKIRQHLDYINGKIRGYLKELDEADAREESEREADDKLRMLEQVSEQLKRRKQYEHLLEELAESEETQVSTTDPDARSLPIRRQIVEVAYAQQTAVDAKHNLIVNFETTNRSDERALADLAIDTKEQLRVEGLDALADKGYHTGEELKRCSEANIRTYVAPVASSQRSRKHQDFTKDQFTYDGQTDTYRCPAGETLTTKGKWYEKRGSRKGQKTYRFKRYEAPLEVCRACPFAEQCGPFSRGHGRYIERTEYDAYVEANRGRVEANKEYYRRRQAIVEHPFGTIKRQWGFSYVLLKGLEKVSGETALIYTCYNLRRSVSILGVRELIRRLEGVILAFFWSGGVMARQVREFFNNLMLEQNYGRSRQEGWC